MLGWSLWPMLLHRTSVLDHYLSGIGVVYDPKGTEWLLLSVSYKYNSATAIPIKPLPTTVLQASVETDMTASKRHPLRSSPSIPLSHLTLTLANQLFVSGVREAHTVTPVDLLSAFVCRLISPRADWEDTVHEPALRFSPHTRRENKEFITTVVLQLNVI
jgi:hypothetical protein